MLNCLLFIKQSILKIKDLKTSTNPYKNSEFLF